MTKQSVFTGKEQAQILTALVQLANQCPELPCKVYLDTLSEKAPAMCLGTMTGGIQSLQRGWQDILQSYRLRST